ncbi:Hydroxysteroid dehydrogenase-like protein 2 [Pseudolycoriella hygida]|uniref:Hydroxysteroid dehydrogenase-like protein 2 n=1 Tax=Pseudolycoriella hygida TaxID=35572 RepID=A0A9Q0MVU3_9DIPT|nr:Hydroxysteroid dehydrogenase-like protein 2 [Pseudolycoriella hygida]
MAARSKARPNLRGLTIFITGASRGIGRAIALKAASDGANIVIAAKTDKPHPKLPGTIHTVAKEVEDAGGKALAVVVDVRDEKQIQEAVRKAVEKFGGIDILINNASAIALQSTLETDMKRYDLMQSINTRGTFLVSKECLPYLQKSSHAHILTMSPPLNLSPIWFSNNLAYTMAKYGMSMCVMGMAEEFKGDGVAVNALWPRKVIATAALRMLRSDESFKFARNDSIMADAAYEILRQRPSDLSGQFLIDEDVLKAAGVNDFQKYSCVPENSNNLISCIFNDAATYESIPKAKL